MKTGTVALGSLLLLAFVYAAGAVAAPKEVVLENKYGDVTREHDKFRDETTIGIELDLDGKRFYIFEYWYSTPQGKSSRERINLRFALDGRSFFSGDLIVLVGGERQRFSCTASDSNLHCHDIPTATVLSWIKAGTVEGRAVYKDFVLRPEHMELLRTYLTAIGAI